MDNLLAIGVLIGLVNGARLFNQEDKTGFYYFLLAVGLGVVFGLVGFFGLTVETGIMAALASSGLYQVSKFSGK